MLLLKEELFSPLLFNIYMLGFDDNIYDEFITPIIEENKNKLNKVESKT